MKTKMRKEAVASAVLGLCGVAAIALAGNGTTNCYHCHTHNGSTTCRYSVRNCSSNEICVGEGGVTDDGLVWAHAECRKRNGLTP